MTQFTKKLLKRLQNGSQGDPKIHTKSIKIRVWTPRGPIGGPWVSPGHQNGAMGSQNGTLGYPNGAKMEPWGTQMEPKWCPKVPKYGVLDSAGDHILEHFPPRSINPESPSNLESPSNPAVLPVLLIAKGAGGRGEALRYIYYIYNYVWGRGTRVLTRYNRRPL